MKKLVTTHNLGKIKMREYYDDTMEWGEPKSIYYTATIDGWRGFKFITSELKAQQLFEKSYELCKKILDDIRSNDTNCLDKYENIININ